MRITIKLKVNNILFFPRYVHRKVVRFINSEYEKEHVLSLVTNIQYKTNKGSCTCGSPLIAQTYLHAILVHCYNYPNNNEGYLQ